MSDMASFVGNFPRQLDERGRFVLPAKLRERISGCVHITRSLADKCLMLYTEQEWALLEEQVRDLPTTTNIFAKQFVQVVFGQAWECEVDKQGRIALPDYLLEAAGMKRDIVLAGANAKMEIWDADTYNKTIESLDFDKILAGVSQFGLNI